MKKCNLIICLLAFLFSCPMRAEDNATCHASGKGPIAMYNAGVEVLNQNNFEQAAICFALAKQEFLRRDRKAKAGFNEAYAQIKLGALPEAEETLKEAQSYDLDNEQIKENLKWVQDILNEQKQSEGDQNQQSKDGQNEKESQKQNQQQGQSEEQDGQNQEQNQSQSDQGDNSGDQKEQQQQQEQSSEPENNSDQGSRENQGEQGDQQTQDSKSGSEKNQDDSSEDEKNASAESEEMARQSESQPLSDEEKTNKASAEASQPEAENLENSSESMLSDSSETFGEPVSEKDVRIQDAEKLLRSVGDRVGRYHIRRKDVQERSDNGNEW
ncbi:MAG: hypothetical protein HRU19_03435 [Pseudobacteriovorax sp.]|nr:hypothetical protein [Pseudobacteriovorax sp.]